LNDKNAPFGVDLLLPQVGGGARKTNADYTEGKLPELIDIIIESGAKLFVSAVGVPPRWAVDKLHAAGIPYMNMIGAPKHVEKALAAGADIICAQGGEGGGHTGDVATSILIPVVVDLCKGRRSALTNAPVAVVAAGGIFDGRGLAMALSFGAQAVWVGTRFICATEAGAPPRHQQAVIDASYHDTIRTVIFTGRPMRVVKNPYIMHWEENRQQEIRELCDNGVIPYTADLEDNKPKGAAGSSSSSKIGDPDIPEAQAGAAATFRPLLMGQCAGAIKDIQPAKQIVDEMVDGAIVALRTATAFIGPKAKL
jgi:NAD(P)H-dependent flavin oxidoreductase YrpB (nitropropane dioxygenase family)